MEINSSKFYYSFFLALGLLLTVIFIFSDDEKKVDLSEIKFDVKENNSLRFKNLRQYYYDTEIISNNLQNVYRLRASIINKDKFSFAIIENVYSDEAFIVPEFKTNTGLEKLKIIAESDNSIDTIKIKEPLSLESYYIFAGNLYEKLINYQAVKISTADTSYNMNEVNIKNLKTVMKDYFKMVNKI